METGPKPITIRKVVAGIITIALVAIVVIYYCEKRHSHGEPAKQSLTQPAETK